MKMYSTYLNVLLSVTELSPDVVLQLRSRVGQKSQKSLLVCILQNCDQVQQSLLYICSHKMSF